MPKKTKIQKKKVIKEFTTGKIVKIGNSFYVKIPKAIVHKYELKKSEKITQKYDHRKHRLINILPNINSKELMIDEKKVMDILSYFPTISKPALLIKFSGGTKSNKELAKLTLAEKNLMKMGKIKDLGREITIVKKRKL